MTVKDYFVKENKSMPIDKAAIVVMGFFDGIIGEDEIFMEQQEHESLFAMLIASGAARSHDCRIDVFDDSYYFITNKKGESLKIKTL